MATTDDLVISIRADIGALQSQLRNIDAQLRGTERQGNETANAIKNMALQFVSLGAAIEGMKKLVDVNRNFGILKAGLETATGSIEGANQAFAALQQFAQTTPYSLQQAVDGFTKLVNLGLTPSEAALKSYGDTSAALGKDLSQMIEAVADAATGEFERLKEFGIKAKNNGDSIAFTFKGTTETVRNNAAEIESYLIKLGQVNFDGAMTKRMESLDGAISNLSDSFEGFFYQIGESGATESLNSGIRKLGQGLTDLTGIVKQIPLSNFKSAMDAAGDAVLLFAGYKITKMVAGLALATQETIKNIAAQSASRVETLANAEADAIAANMAARRAIVEKQLALDELNKARATTASALATQQSAIADLEAAQLQSRLALGTQQATVANLARAMAAEKVTAAQLEVAAAANAESAAIARATTASAANTAAATANATAQQALATATTNATIAGRTSGTMLTALGGPLGAVVTALGLAATAWFVFGDSAEKAADQTKQAIDKIKNNLNITDDEAKALDDSLKEVEQSIKSTLDSVRAASLTSNDKLSNALNTQLQELYNKKKEIEDTIPRFLRLLNME
jgi:hydrogenase maturation factor